MNEDAIPTAGSELRADLPAEEVVARRAGDVLLRHTILKSDHFPGCQNMKLTPLLEGAPNFRQVPGLPVFGVAIPTISGVRLVLDRMGAAKGRRKVLWHNMREEPVLYVNGRPFVVREADKPFANLEYSGIDRERVEGMEARLKQDVLVEAAQYGGSVLVAHEDDHFQVVEEWEPVTEVDVQTPAEVYAELVNDGYDVDYLRVPVTDEKAPDADDVETLVTRCWSPPEGAALVFNCQMGRGRTTSGMAIGCLLYLRRLRATLSPPPSIANAGLPGWFAAAAADDALSASSRVGTLGATGAAAEAASFSEEAELRAGRFAAIRSLLRVLPRGREAKSSLDCVLDACAAMQNLREAIATYRTRLYYERNDARRQSLLQVLLEYLERYYMLIVFAAYLDDPGFQPGSHDHVVFEGWCIAQPELQGILRRLLRTNPLAALALDRGSAAADAAGGPAGSKAASAAGPAAEDSDSLELDAEHEAFADVIARRQGSVLGPHTILKQDHFPGCQSSRLPAVMEGAPNFRGIAGEGVQVYGGAIATVAGMRSVLAHVGAAPSAEGSRSAVWHMMREEPVVFVSGEPYVLREDSRPFKNLLEYRGIDATRLDQMEQRLRDDVVVEAAQCGGRLLVTSETSTPDGRRSLEQKFVSLADGAASVQTPHQVFEQLQAEGFLVTFVRVPLTDGTCPRAADFDLFFSAAAAAGPAAALIYSCQLGGGRTTMGTAIGALLRMYINDVRVPEPSDMERAQTLEMLDEDVGGGSPRGGFDDEDATHFEASDPFGDLNPSPADQQALAQGAAPASPSFSLPAGPVETPYDAETRNLMEGEYVGMRRFIRILERGPEAKMAVDSVVDACGMLINLRTSIMRYRKPKSTQTFYRPEIQARHSAFQRGSAYLERYCMLVAFAVYLRERRQSGLGGTFQEWLEARPDVQQAREAIHQNPAGALAPVPPAFPPPGPAGRAPAAGLAASRQVPIEEQRRVLFKRRGSTVGRRSILKSFTMAPPRGPDDSEAPAASLQPQSLYMEGVTDVRQARDLPVYALGNATVAGLRQLLHKLGAAPGDGSSHVVVTDLREELVLYISGTAYLRRELEMPAAALHHAGIQAGMLEELERRLQADMMAEAAAWGGRVLLHREFAAAAALGGHRAGAGATTEAEPRSAAALGPAEQVHQNGGSTNGRQPGPEVGSPALRPSPYAVAAADGSAGLPPGEEDITRSTDFEPTTQVTAFWQPAGPAGNIDEGMCTPVEVFSGLQAEGFRLSYRRVPMSRERTPQAADLDRLYVQLRDQPPGASSVAHVFVSRTAAGSSARFAAAFACMSLRAMEGADAAAAGAARRGTTILGTSPTAAMSLSPLARDVSPVKHARSDGLLRNDSELSDLVRSVEAGEYRGVMNLCRVLTGGTEVKEAVDAAIDSCGHIGNLRTDIFRCKEAAEDEAGADAPQAAAAARQLGLHYLQRYFYLVAFRGYLESVRSGANGGCAAPSVLFSQWVGQRRELTYLLSTLELN